MQELTIREAAQRAGITEKALRRRLERGTLRAVRGEDGFVRVSVEELERVGLLTPAGNGNGARAGHRESLAGLVARLVAELGSQAEELGRLRAVERAAHRLRDEVARLEQEVLDLQNQLADADGSRRFPLWRRPG